MSPSNATDKLRAKLASFIQQLDRASAPESRHCGTDKSDTNGKITHDALRRDAEHLIPEAREIPIAPLISAAPPSVDAAPRAGRESCSSRTVVPRRAAMIPCATC